MAHPEDPSGPPASPGPTSVARPPRSGGDSYADEAHWARFTEARGLGERASAWLALQCRLLPGVRRGLLLLGAAGEGPFATAAVWPEGNAPSSELLGAAEQSLTKRDAVVLGAAGTGQPRGEGQVLALPLESGGRLRGAVVVEVGHEVATPPISLLQQLRWGTGWLQASLVQSHAGVESEARGRFQTVLELLAATLEQERFRGAATALVTELATALGCERAALGFLKRGRVHLEALSHSAHFGKKTNLTRAIEAAMGEAVDQAASVVYPAPEDATVRGTHAHAELARRHDAGAIASVPLVHAGEIVGVLTLERSEGRRFDAATLELCEAIAALAGPALEVLRREDRWLAAKAAESVRTQLEHLFGPRHVALKLVAAGAGALLLFLALATGEYRITADALLEPAVLRAAVSPFEGYVAEAPARAGDVVEEGTLLASLDARDLELERLKWVSQEQQLRKQYRQALAEREAAEAEVLAASLAEARAELERILDRLSRTRITAPFDGVVVTGDLSQELGAPVERGQVLFEVAPLDAYRLILQVDERDIADVALGQTGRLVLSSLPDEPIGFEVVKITPVSTAEEGANFFRVEAALDRADPRLRPEIEGVGKIEVGGRRLLWIWTHDAVDWLRLRLWNWLP